MYTFFVFLYVPQNLHVHLELCDFVQIHSSLSCLSKVCSPKGAHAHLRIGVGTNSVQTSAYNNWQISALCKFISKISHTEGRVSFLCQILDDAQCRGNPSIPGVFLDRLSCALFTLSVLSALLVLPLASRCPAFSGGRPQLISLRLLSRHGHHL